MWIPTSGFFSSQPIKIKHSCNDVPKSNSSVVLDNNSYTKWVIHKKKERNLPLSDVSSVTYSTIKY